MRRRAGEFLADILEAIEAIERYTSVGEDAFRDNGMAVDAVCLRLIQIGEAVKKAQEAGLDLPGVSPEIPWTKITGMRDVIAHHYWRVDHDILWATVQQSLRPLKEGVQKASRRYKTRGSR